jgi:hypothetical protein
VSQIKFYSSNLKYGWMSNFYHAPFHCDGKDWNTVEHAYQASKTYNKEEQEAIRLAPTPGEAKRLGAKCTLRNDWDFVKDYIMMRIVLFKFMQHPDLLNMLKATTEELIEDSPTDYYWGCGADGTGRNQLGKTLMDVRSAFNAV